MNTCCNNHAVKHFNLAVASESYWETEHSFCSTSQTRSESLFVLAEPSCSKHKHGIDTRLKRWMCALRNKLRVHPVPGRWEPLKRNSWTAQLFRFVSYVTTLNQLLRFCSVEWDVRTRGSYPGVLAHGNKGYKGGQVYKFVSGITTSEEVLKKLLEVVSVVAEGEQRHECIILNSQLPIIFLE